MNRNGISSISCNSVFHTYAMIRTHVFIIFHKRNYYTYLGFSSVLFTTLLSIYTSIHWIINFIWCIRVSMIGFENQIFRIQVNGWGSYSWLFKYWICVSLNLQIIWYIRCCDAWKYRGNLTTGFPFSLSWYSSFLKIPINSFTHVDI